MLITLKACHLRIIKICKKTKKVFFDALDTWQNCVDMATFVLDELKVNVERTREAALKGYSNATELADYLVSKGVPFEIPIIS